MGMLLPLVRPEAQAPRPLVEHLPPGRLVEIAGDARSGRLSLATVLVRAVQRERDTVAWVQPRGGGLYPPDLAAAGVDLDGLVVIHIPPQAGASGITKAAELLLRSGALGLVVLDLSTAAPPRGEAWLNRLAALAREHQSRVLLLVTASADTASLGALVSLRLVPERTRLDAERLAVHPTLVKDKLGLGGISAPALFRSPWSPRCPS